MKRPPGAALLVVLLGVCSVPLAGCKRYHRHFGMAAENADAGAPPAFQAAEVDVGSHRTARWWTYGDAGPPGPSEYYPCTDCHDDEMERNPKVRKLEEDHDDMVFDHGHGKIWCLNCHQLQDRTKLRDGAGRSIPWDQPWKMCATCHMVQARDFEHGVHGKRLDTYTAPRTLASCIACHNPHSPAIRPRKPKPPPLRSRLELEGPR